MSALNARPVFVGGCPRSGTTLLRTMLNSHPDLAIPHETRFLIDAYRMRRDWGRLSNPENRRRLARWVVERKRSRVERLTDDPAALVERMVAAPPTLGSVLREGYLVYAEQHGKAHWGDKRPSYAVNLDAVFALFPDARYINVVRDPRAVVASIRKVGRQQGWYRHGIAAGAEAWELTQRETDRWQQRLPADQFLEIQYEHLVTDPPAVLGRIIEFLELDPSGLDPMLRHHETADIQSRRMHSLVAQPVTTDAVRSWEQTLTKPEVALVESALGEQMRRYGYEPVSSGVDPPRRLVQRLEKRRQETRRKFAQRRRDELWRRLGYRRAVAARR